MHGGVGGFLFRCDSWCAGMLFCREAGSRDECSKADFASRMPLSLSARVRMRTRVCVRASFGYTLSFVNLVMRRSLRCRYSAVYFFYRASSFKEPPPSPSSAFQYTSMHPHTRAMPGEKENRSSLRPLDVVQRLARA